MDEEGTYGAPPRQPGMPPASPAPRVRERKPKVYSSYAVDSGCEAHGTKVITSVRITIFEGYSVSISGIIHHHFLA